MSTEDGADPTGLSIFADRSEQAGQADGTEAPEAPPRPRRRGRRLLLAVLLTVLLITGGCTGALYWTADHYASSVARIPGALPSLAESERPRPVPNAGVTFLLVGLDARTDAGAPAKAPVWQAGAARSDTMMLLHLSADRKNASVISLARDTWVDVPGHGKAKLNAAYSLGGPALMVRTVQDLTGIPVDHLAVVDWNGFRSLTDAVGGVDITIPKEIEGKGEARHWAAGTQHMDGTTALLYVRERYGLPNGDLDRTKRQQNFLRALMQQTLSSGTLGNPGKLTGLLGSVGEVVSVDDKLSNTDLYDLAWSLRGLRGDGVRFMNAPFGGFGDEGGQSVVYLDQRVAKQLWEAVRNDRVTEYLAEHPGTGDTLGENVR
ncbi:LCP family protein [Kitasatospora sp. NBC_00070]|uniref:LCP family protein n=1 Tax=Kitasatospora sp. NBC_00070 TaxID=2975962 RepID=UPI0032569817